MGREGEGDRKRKRADSGEQKDSDDPEDGHSGQIHPRKRTGQVRPDEQHPAEDKQHQAAQQGDRQTANSRSPDQAATEGDVKLIVDENGFPQISSGSPTEKESQDAFLFGGISLPPRPSSAHATDHELNTPLPASVREELLAANKNTHTTTKGRKAFSLLIAFCRKNDLLLTLVSYLPIPSIISLYAISKTFRFLFNRHHTAFILASMRTWAPNADIIYPWRCYKSVCTSDPQLRQKMRYHGLDEEEAVFRLGRKGMDVRNVPTLRWLQMVVWRQGVCKDMLVMLATKGLRCPPGTLDAVKVSKKPMIDIREDLLMFLTAENLVHSRPSHQLPAHRAHPQPHLHPRPYHPRHDRLPSQSRHGLHPARRSRLPGPNGRHACQLGEQHPHWRPFAQVTP